MTREQTCRRRIVEVARTWIGTPYHHQASLKGVGADCLGLVRGVYAEVKGHPAATPPAYTPDWAEARGEETLLTAAMRHLRQVSTDEARSGDVLIFRMRAGSPAKHAGILVSSSSFVHAAERYGVSEVALSAWWRRRLVAAFALSGRED